MKLSFTVAVALGIVLSGVSPAHADTDPFPGVEHMGEVPGTKISSPPWSNQAEWEATATYQNYLAQGCPEGTGRAIAVDVAVMVWSNYCVKTWRSQAVIRAWEKYYSDEAEGRATALAQSVAWNQANPGKQKCFSYGPLTSPDGGTTSGGVCANAIPAVPTSSAPPGSATTPTTPTTPAIPESEGDTALSENKNSEEVGSQNTVTPSTSLPSESPSPFVSSEEEPPVLTRLLLASLPRG